MNWLLLVCILITNNVFSMEKDSLSVLRPQEYQSSFFVEDFVDRKPIKVPVQRFLDKPLRCYKDHDFLSNDGFVKKIFNVNDDAHSAYNVAMRLIKTNKLVGPKDVVKSKPIINVEHNFCNQKDCLKCCGYQELTNSLHTTSNQGSLKTVRHPLDYTEFLTESINDKSNQLAMSHSHNSSSVARSLCDSLGMSFQEVVNNDAHGYGAGQLLGIPLSEEQKIARYAKVELEKEAQRIVNGGALVYELLFTNNSLPEAELLSDDQRKERLNSLVDYMWYLYHEQARKEEAFVEGTFTTADNNSRIHDYFMRYVKGVNPAVTGTLQDPALTHAKNPFAYPRKSSHFKELVQRQYGIDTRVDANGYCSLELPAQKGHLFFVKDENDTISIKMENYGLGYREVGHHALEFGIAFLRKIPGVKKMFTSDDDPLYRKERIPAAFKAMVDNKINVTADVERRVLLTKAKVLGIKKLFAQEPLDNSLIELLDKEYDHLPLRRGREAILTHETISSLYYYILKTKPQEAAPLKKIFDTLGTTRLLLKKLKSAQQNEIAVIEQELNQMLITQLTPNHIAALNRHNTTIHSYVLDARNAIFSALRIQDPQQRLKALTPIHGFFENQNYRGEPHA